MNLHLVACPISKEPGRWDFFVVNGTAADIDEVTLESVEWEWGNHSHIERPLTTVPKVSAGKNVLIFSGNDDELRMTFVVSGKVRDLEIRWVADVGMLYHKKEQLPWIDELGRLGFAAEMRELG